MSFVVIFWLLLSGPTDAGRDAVVAGRLVAGPSIDAGTETSSRAPWAGMPRKWTTDQRQKSWPDRSVLAEESESSEETALFDAGFASRKGPHDRHSLESMDLTSRPDQGTGRGLVLRC